MDHYLRLLGVGDLSEQVFHARGSLSFKLLFDLASYPFLPVNDGQIAVELGLLLGVKSADSNVFCWALVVCLFFKPTFFDSLLLRTLLMARAATERENAGPACLLFGSNHDELETLQDVDQGHDPHREAE